MCACVVRASTTRTLHRIKTSMVGLVTGTGIGSSHGATLRSTLVTSTVVPAGTHDGEMRASTSLDPSETDPSSQPSSKPSSKPSSERPGSSELSRSTSSARPSEAHKLKKKALRATIKATLKTLTPEQKKRESERVCSTILDELQLIDKLPPSAGICLYLACETLNEVDADRILQRAFERDIRVYLPRVLDRDSNMHFLRVHAHDTYDVVPPFGIREPTLLDAVTGKAREDVLDADTSLDVILMPGLGFGDGGQRLGRGGGYYDAFIDRFVNGRGADSEDGQGGKGGPKVGRGTRTKPLLVGLAFDAQIMDGNEVPMDTHDHYLDMIVSATRVLTTKRTGG